MSTDYGKNKKTAAILQHYIELKDPKFAVLINGEWGCGKTWFINDFLNRQRDKHDSQVANELKQNQDDNAKQAFCYVSLFDITQASEIDTAILHQQNPFLFSKTAKNVGRLGRVALEKIPFSIFFGVDGKIITSCFDHAKDFFCVQATDMVIVFDDIERTRLPLDLVLGYVSNLIETSNAKVIMIANQEEIAKENGASESKFVKFKEKVVGLTLTVQSDFESVFSATLKSINNEAFVKVMGDSKNIIFENFKNSKSNNFRHIRRIIHELYLVYNITSSLSLQEDFWDAIVNEVSIFSILIHKNSIQIDSLEYFYDDDWITLNKTSSISGMDILDMHTKFNNELKNFNITIYKLALSPSFFKNYFQYGEVDSTKMLVLQDKFRTVNQEIRTFAPLKIWSFWELNDEEFSALYTEMCEALASKKYLDLGIVIHAFTTKMQLAREKIISDTVTDITDAAIEYLRNTELHINDIEKVSFVREYKSPSYAGCVFHCVESSEVQKLLSFAREIVSNSLETRKRAELEEVCQALKSDTSYFLEHFPFDKSKYIDMSIPSGILNSDDFVKSITMLDASTIKKVTAKIRYELGILHRSCSADIGESVKSAAQAILDKLGDVDGLSDKPLVRYALQEFKKDLERARNGEFR